MAITKDQQHQLSDFARERIKGVIKNDPAFGAIRGMLYNNLQEWKRLMFELNYSPRFTGEVPNLLHVQGELRDAMRLSEGDKQFLMEELLSIDDLDFSDEFLLKIADKTVKKLQGVKNPTMPQKGLLEDLKGAMQEALTGNPF